MSADPAIVAAHRLVAADPQIVAARRRMPATDAGAVTALRRMLNAPLHGVAALPRVIVAPLDGVAALPRVIVAPLCGMAALLRVIVTPLHGVAALRRVIVAGLPIVTAGRLVLVADPLIVAAGRDVADPRIVGPLDRMAEPAVVTERRDLGAKPRVMRLRLLMNALFPIVGQGWRMNLGPRCSAWYLRTADIAVMGHRPAVRARALVTEFRIVRSVPVMAVARIMRSGARVRKDRPVPNLHQRKCERQRDCSGWRVADLIDCEIADLGRVVAQQRVRV